MILPDQLGRFRVLTLVERWVDSWVSGVELTLYCADDDGRRYAVRRVVPWDQLHYATFNLVDVVREQMFKAVRRA